MDGVLEKMLPKEDVQNVDVKFINDKQNGEAKLDIGNMRYYDSTLVIQRITFFRRFEKRVRWNG